MQIGIARIQLGEPTVGIWCERCLTSGGFRVDTYLLTEHGVSDGALGPIRGCTTCQTYDFERGPAGDAA
jgi:hypothetical protein